jgi:hypothetical protein
MTSPDAQEGRPLLHEPDSGFGLDLHDLGGISRWSRSDMLGEERSKQRLDESIGVFSVAEGYMYSDPNTGETYISERPNGTGKRLDMNDVLPSQSLAGAVEVEIIIRVRELPEHEVDVIEGQLPEPLWIQRR